MPESGKAPATPAKAAPGSGSEGLLGRLGELAWKALPAIGSAIGFVGFVAIIGGAIEWIRFDAAQLPPTQAVLAIPKQELVIEGARALIVFVVLAVLAVLAVYLIDSKGNATPRTARGLVLVGALGLLLAVFLIRGHHDVGTYVVLIAAVVWITVVAVYIVGLAMLDFRCRTQLKHARGRVIDALVAALSAEDARAAANATALVGDSEEIKAHRAEAHGAAAMARTQFERAVGEWEAAADQVLELHVSGVQEELRKKRDLFAAPVDELPDRDDRIPHASEPPGRDEPVPEEELPGRFELEAKLDEAEKALGKVVSAIIGQAHVAWEEPRSFLAAAQVITLCAGAVIITLIAAGVAELPQQVLILALVVVLLTTMNIFVARATDKFAWYGVSVFFSVLMFGAALTIASTLEQPKVQPIALVRKDNELGVCGVYVTQTSQRVYVGRLPLPGYRPGLIFWVPTSDVDLVSVGQPVRVGNRHEASFSKEAEGMLNRLYKDRAEEAAPPLKNTTITTVSGDPSSIKGQTTTASETPPVKERSKRHPGVKIYERSCTSTQAVDP